VEKWDIYDKDGNLTGKMKTRNDAFDVGEYHLGVSLWVVVCHSLGIVKPNL